MAVVLFLNYAYANICVAMLFMIAIATDFFDGYLAKKFSAQSELGRCLDPIADKMLIASVMIMLIYTQVIVTWHVFAVIIILFREILIAGVREYLATVNFSLPVSNISKWKTALQMTAMISLLVCQEISNNLQILISLLSQIISLDIAILILSNMIHIGIITLWVSAILTIITGYDYVKHIIKSI